MKHILPTNFPAFRANEKACSGGLRPSMPMKRPKLIPSLSAHWRYALLTLSAVFLLSSPAHTQGTENLLTTLGTTVDSTVDGKTHAYLLWQPGDAAVTFGKRYAIHSKPGDADSPAPFTRLGIQTLQGSPNTVRAMLELGVKIDPGAADAPGRIDALYRQLLFDPEDPAPPEDPDPTPPIDPAIEVAGKLLFIMQSAATDSETLSRLFFLGRAHPGVMMALGHGFSIPVAAGVHTFEVREVDSADNDLRVVGRVTLDTANPVIPAAPAAPFPVPHTVKPADYHTVSPKDHLNVRLRWGIPPGLRGQMPHTFGFDMFRVKKDDAETLGWHVSPPPRADLLAAVAASVPTDLDPDFARANTLPILVGDLLTPAEASNPDDTERIDFSDDGVWHLDSNGDPVRRPYQDGEAFYFFVAARNICGIPGEISPGALVVMCDTLPPKPPSIESVTSQFTAPATPAGWKGQGGTQHLQVKLRQLPQEPASGAATRYYIYRWSRSQEYLDNVGNPLIGRIGHVDHEPGQTFATFDDNGAGAPTLATHADRSVWYTVRAAGVSACPDEILSGHSAPLPGFLRDFKAPDTASGDFVICRQLPTAIYQGSQATDPGQYDLPKDYVGVTIRAERSSPVIVAADIEVFLNNSKQEPIIIHSKRHSYRKSDQLLVNLPYRQPDNEANIMVIRVSGVTAHGQVSAAAVASEVNLKNDPYLVHSFRLEARQDCGPVSSAPGPRPVHEAYDVAGNLNPIIGSISFDPGQGVREWRVYRRVGSDGELSLIAKNEGDSLASPAPWVDDALPAANGSRVCYFVQVLDQNANPSPLFPIGCTTLLNPDLPTPMLAPAKITGENGDRMTVALEWFCDPVGVDRFEILVAREGGGIPDPEGLSGLLASEALAGISADFPDLEFHRFQTTRVGGILGNGPGFVAEIDLPADATHFFAVRACGPGEPDARASGSASNVASARWVIPPAVNQPIIPWPARPLPGRYDHRLPIGQYTTAEGPLWPLVLPTDFGVATTFLVGVTKHPLQTNTLGTFASLQSPEPPENHLFHLRESRGSATPLTELMPFMLFRYQLPSDRFPDARANIVQCTPLIDRMSWRQAGDKDGKDFYEIRDPWFRFLDGRFSSVPIPVSGIWNSQRQPDLGIPANLTNPPPYLEDFTGMILLCDLLPVTVGARYRHLLVQFDARGEIKRVIPLDPVQH